MTDDDPLDLARLAADDAALEQLRRGHPAGADGDPALLLLGDLLRDVGADLPEPLPLDAPLGTTVVTVAGERPSRRRLARQGAVVAGVTAAVVSFGGIAAASTSVDAASPLHGIGQAVRSAAGAVVGAVSLPDPRPTPTAQAPAAAAPAAPADDAAARSQAAARQVDGLLDAAQRLLAAGRPEVASARLDDAERRLAAVAPQDAGDLARRLEQLRRDVQSATAAPAPARPGPAAPPAPAQQPTAPEQQAPPQQAPPRQAPQQQAPQRPQQQEPKEPQQGPQQGPRQEPAARETTAPAQQLSDDERQAPARVPEGARELRGASRTPAPPAGGQPSSDASTKPRA